MKDIIEHETPSDANLFLDLGFEGEEAKALWAEAQKQVSDKLRLKEELMDELTHWMESNQLKQAEAALILKVSRPRVSDMVNKKSAKFTIDALVDMLSRVGKPVRLVMG